MNCGPMCLAPKSLTFVSPNPQAHCSTISLGSLTNHNRMSQAIKERFFCEILKYRVYRLNDTSAYKYI